jgi:hypothetical protein
MAAAEEKTRANESLASVLGAYRGFCERNQIDLELKLCEGPSIKKALVAEATSCAAAHLILGVTKSSRPSGYALHLFHFHIAGCFIEKCSDAETLFVPFIIRSSATATAVARYCAKRVPPSCMVTAVSNGAVVYRRDPVHQHHQLLLSPYSAVVETPRRLYRKILDARTTAGDKSQDDMTIGASRSVRRHMSAAMSALVSPRVKLAPAGPARSCHGQQESPKMAAGWPLLKKDNMPALPELSEVSVVEWAMQLPTRCSDQSSDERGEEKPVPEELVSLRDKYSSKYTVFRYSELAKITNGFSPGTSLFQISMLRF